MVWNKGGWGAYIDVVIGVVDVDAMHRLLEPNVGNPIATDVVVVHHTEGQAWAHLLDVLSSNLHGIAGGEWHHVVLRGLDVLGTGVVGHHREAEGV